MFGSTLEVDSDILVVRPGIPEVGSGIPGADFDILRMGFGIPAQDWSSFAE